MKKLVVILVVFVFTITNFYAQSMIIKKSKMSDKLEIATLANGCFWCTEAIFQRLNGVEKVTSGYSGGKVKNPSYREVTTGETGHAEVIQIQFNPSVITFQEILDVFFSTHDPTTLNKQGHAITATNTDMFVDQCDTVSTNKRGTRRADVCTRRCFTMLAH